MSKPKLTNVFDDEKEEKPKKEIDNSFEESLIIGAVTNSTIIGGLLGGNLLGAMIGDKLNGDD